MGWYGDFKPYVPVAERREKAEKHAKKMGKAGIVMNPVRIMGRTIVSTFWGKAWCKHLESFSDYDNRLPRGRTYVRNGSVIDLKIHAGKVTALVSGSELYHVIIDIAALQVSRWEKMVKACLEKIDSIVELLQGKLSGGVMEVMTQPSEGLFPQGDEMTLSCSCPDYARLCKHVAAVLYGVGSRLDEAPEALFLLRQVDHQDLIAQVAADNWQQPAETVMPILEEEALSALFGIDMIGASSSQETLAITEEKKEKIISVVESKKRTNKEFKGKKTEKREPKLGKQTSRPTPAQFLKQFQHDLAVVREAIQNMHIR